MDSVGSASLFGGLPGFAFAAPKAAAKAANKQAQLQQDVQRGAERRGQMIAQRQAVESASVEKRKRINQSNMIQSRIRAASGESGIGFGGTALALQRQADFDLEANTDLINRTLANQLESIQAGATTFIQAERSPELEGITAGLSTLTQVASLGVQAGGVAQRS